MKLLRSLLRLWPGRNAESTTALATVPDQAPSTMLQAVLEAADDGLVVCDALGHLLLLNPAAASLLGVQPLRLSGPVEWPAPARRLKEVLEQALIDGYAKTELDLERAGRLFQLECRANCIYSPEGRIDGAVLVVRDVTRLRELVAARSDDWAALAHDLKTPLNSISGFTTLLLQDAVGPLNAMQRDFLKTIEHEGQRLLLAVQGFLEEARSGGSADRLQTVELRLAPVVEETVDRLRSLAMRKSITIEVSLAADLPNVEADREKIGLVLMNLLDNAISFSPDGGQITIQAQEQAGSLQVSVEDEGSGIPPEALTLVFGRFYRAPNQPESRRLGVGLGLALSKQVVEKHGGRIWAENRPVGGARLTFTLPLAYRQTRLEALEAAL